MLTITNLSLHFGGRTLFDEVSFQILPTDRIGLIGRNGAGKSTLLKLIVGIYKPDGGDVSYPKGYRIGYLPQDIQSDSVKSVFDETKTAFKHILVLEDRVKELAHLIETRTDYESDEYMNIIEEFNEKDQQLMYLGGQNMDEEIHKVLKGLGFDEKDLGKEVKSLSGGWQMRIELAKILLQKPDLLLLDEPTNHLDIESVTWLENFLKNYPGGILMISHDKAFLNNITNRTLEIFAGDIDDYRAPYNKYIELRKERKEQQINAKKNQEREIRQIERNIERFRAKASKAAFAQSLIKKLDKIEVIEVDEEDISKMNIRFPDSIQSGKLVLEARSIVKTYGEKKVIKSENFYINKGDKIAFVGKNGMGKTTLSRIIAGDLTYEGELMLGHNVMIGYYAQHQAEMLSSDKTVFETIDEAATGEMRSRVRTLLGCFLFSGDDVDKKVKVLSGGEKGRLAMCKLLLEPVNLLILDEPTNHLDMIAKETLKQALLAYSGTLILVSHDRDFLQGLSNRIFEFTEFGIKEHLGDIYDFLKSKEMDDFRTLELQKSSNNIAQTENKKERTKSGNESELKQLRNKSTKLESQISDLEAKILQIEEELKKPETYSDNSLNSKILAEYEAKKNELNKVMEEWELVNLEIEEKS